MPLSVNDTERFILLGAVCPIGFVPLAYINRWLGRPFDDLTFVESDIVPFMASPDDCYQTEVSDSFYDTGTTLKTTNSVTHHIINGVAVMLYAESLAGDGEESTGNLTRRVTLYLVNQANNYEAHRSIELPKSTPATDEAPTVAALPAPRQFTGFTADDMAACDKHGIKRFIDFANIDAQEVRAMSLSTSALEEIASMFYWQMPLCDVIADEMTVRALNKAQLNTLGDVRKLNHQQLLSVPQIGERRLAAVVKAVYDKTGLELNAADQ